MKFVVILTNALMLFEFLSLFYVMFQRKFRERTPRKIIEIVSWILLWSIAMIIGFDWQRTIAGPVSAFFIVYVLLIWILFDISIKETMVLGLANWLILSIVEENVIIALQTMYKLDEWYFDGIIMFVISCFIWGFYIIRRNYYKDFYLPIKIWALLDVMLLILMAMLSFFTYVIVRIIPDAKMSSTGQVLLLFGGVLIIVLLFVFVFYYSASYEYRIQKELMEMQVKQQRDYFEKLLKREEETKKFRHDILNDLLELQNYCERNECLQMREYLENLTGIVIQISKNSYNVGNSIVNTVLNYYLMPISEKCFIEINGWILDEISVDDRDLCIISANLIKNAVESVSKCESGKICVNIECGKNYLHFQVENTCDGVIRVDKKGLPVTTKEDVLNHGIGLRNVYEIVQKNGGACDFKSENGLFKSNIFIKI